MPLGLESLTESARSRACKWPLPFGHDSKGGAANPSTWEKNRRIYDICRTNRLPLITLTESAGADLPRQADLFVRGGESFKNLTQMSKMGIPTITVVFGPNTAGGAYVPAMSDYTVFVKERGTAYLGGPRL